ncbi:MAG: hypothetical protein K2Q22_10725 [Cytophagales bacterium]|nr:hypothetical protein [Cytophagales bacterium]
MFELYIFEKPKSGSPTNDKRFSMDVPTMSQGCLDHVSTLPNIIFLYIPVQGHAIFQALR